MHSNFLTVFFLKIEYILFVYTERGKGSPILALLVATLWVQYITDSWSST